MTNKKPMTSKGKGVTDVDVEKLAREAEAGYDVPKLRRGRRTQADWLRSGEGDPSPAGSRA